MPKNVYGLMTAQVGKYIATYLLEIPEKKIIRAGWWQAL